MRIETISLQEVKDLYEKVHDVRYAANKAMAEMFVPGREIVFSRGNMRDNHNAEVIVCSCNRIKIKNLFTGKVRWIDLTDVRGI